MTVFWTGVAVAIFAAVAALFVIYRAPVTGAGGDVLYAERCGGSFDGTALTPPLVEVSLYADKIEVRYLSRRISIPFAAIRSVRLARHVLLRGIWIDHDVATAPREFILFCKNNERVRALIEQHMRPDTARIRQRRAST
jgi:hypothetical protein